MTERNKSGYNKSIYDFISAIYVECPSCGKQAIVKGSQIPNNSDSKILQQIRMICSHCGASKLLEEKSPFTNDNHPASAHAKESRVYKFGAPIDPFFHLPLWLSTKVRNNEFWAYNYDHLNFIRDLVEAKLRERNATYHYHNSIGSRLPRWVTSKNNRELILKTISELEHK